MRTPYHSMYFSSGDAGSCLVYCVENERVVITWPSLMSSLSRGVKLVKVKFALIKYLFTEEILN